MATVLIKYVGPVSDDAVRAGMQIPAMFQRDSSYVDTPAYVTGYNNENTVAEDGELADKYGKSIYATNVYDDEFLGTLPGLLPMNSTTTKFAQFERAAMIAVEAAKNGTENAGLTFEVEGYQEEIYWNQMCRNMVAQGFASQVGDNTYGNLGN